jgi:nucleoside phosphorylase/tetratricopeptide (TPR) repeat protein
MGTSKRFEVALSFPGERRDYVAAVAGHLAEQLGRERVLYDKWHEAEFARPGLDTYLQTLYHDQAALIAVFLCADYERKDWCGGVEWCVVKDLIKRRERAAIMPLRFDNTEIPGLFSTDGYIWLGDGRDPAEVAALILTRWQLNGGTLPAEQAPAPEPRPAPRVDITRLPAGAEHFLGRVPELAVLDAAWAPGSGIAIVVVVAPGGTGKTALGKRWLLAQGAAGWGGAGQVFGWSFYSQGTGDDRQASEDLFLATAIARLGIAIDPAANPADKGQAIADKLCARRTLLILDGVEPLQYPPGPLAGELRALGLKALLTQLACAGQPGLCVVTSREWLADLSEWERTAANPRAPVRRIDLGNLSDADGAALLHARGANRAGAAAIGPDDPELIAAGREVQGHALTLSLLGRYLARAKGGDIRRRDAIDLARADRDARGHAGRVIAAYEAWFAGAGRDRELAALRLLGFFDRPAAADLLATLRAAPPIAGLTEALFEPPATPTARGVLGWLRLRKPRPQAISDTDWTLALRDLADCGLIQLDGAWSNDWSNGRLEAGPTEPINAHPLVREYLAAALAERCPAAWREGHRRLYERLKTSAPHRPDGLDGLQPLYQAITHGCAAGFYEEARKEIYIERVLRGTGPEGWYSWKKLGAFDENLCALRHFFPDPWQRAASSLNDAGRAWLFNEAGIQLRALGRLAEALEPFEASVRIDIGRGELNGAAISYSNLSELKLTLGRIAEAIKDAKHAVELADLFLEQSKGEDAAFQAMANRATLGDALHQQGAIAQAHEAFIEADRITAQWRAPYTLLFSVQGFRYCDLLLGEVERGAWASMSEVGSVEGELERLFTSCAQIRGRARQTVKWARENHVDSLSIGLEYLTLARCALYADRLELRIPTREAQDHTDYAIDRLRAAAEQEFIPRGLLTRAWLRHAQGDPDGARADLAEAERIASRGGMALHLADTALYRARLFHDRAALAEARHLIDTHGYARRLPELQDAEAAAALWERLPAATPTRNTPPPQQPGNPAQTSAADPPTELSSSRAVGAASSRDSSGASRIAARGRAHNAPSSSADQTAAPGEAPMTTAADAPTDFLLVAPLPEERDALLARLPGHRKLPPSEDDIRVYYIAEVPARFPDGRPVTYSVVVLPLARMGHTEAASATGDAIRRFRPRYVLLVGIAGGIAANGVGLGDLLLSDQVADYELAKVTADGPSVRWQVHPVDQRLLIAAQNHGGDAFAAISAPRPAPGRPRLHVGPICTGNKVVADDGLAAQLREVWAKLIGVEMEAGGVANAAAQSARRPGFFMIRGVSDLADADKDSAEVKAWRPYACEIAAAWTLHWLQGGPVPAGAAPEQPPREPSPAPTASPMQATVPSSPPAQPGPPANPHADAAALWRQKLDYLLAQEAILASPAQRFELSQQIAECRAKLRELGVEP